MKIISPAGKAKLEQIISKLPFGALILRLYLKNVHCNNKNLYKKDSYNCRIPIVWEIFQKYSQVSPAQATAFEIGAGPDLQISMCLSLLGLNKIITVDICPADPVRVQIVYRFYREHYATFGIKSVPQIKEKFTNKNLSTLLAQYFNIDYRAPYDAAKTDLPDKSIDFVYSISTFEHIRPHLLPGIINEAYRILRSGGIFHVGIDFKDHGIYKNHSRATLYDYLQYSSTLWEKLEQQNKIYYQNRLCLSDYLANFTAAGFEIVEIIKDPITETDRAVFATVKVADEFKNKYTDEELMEKYVHIILRKP